MLSHGYKLPPYTIDRKIGEGGFGVTYLADDLALERKVAIKEFLPASIACRDDDGNVVPIDKSHQEIYQWGLQAFIQEAKTLARFDHANIVKVLHFLEANNTAYMIMIHEEGDNLADIYAAGNHLDQEFFERMFFPILDGLEQVHQLEFIHRDIKPANILLRKNGSPVLIDFGSARQFTQQASKELTRIVSQGYAPVEQYNPAFGKQGPWTDIYALATTLHEGIYGHLPDENSTARPDSNLTQVLPDRKGSGAAIAPNGFSHNFLNAVQAGLAPQIQDRPRSLCQWRAMFDDPNGQQPGTMPATVQPNAATREPLAQATEVIEEPMSAEIPTGTNHAGNSLGRPRWRRWALPLVLLGLLGGGIYASGYLHIQGFPFLTGTSGAGSVSSRLQDMSNWERVIACFRSTPAVSAVMGKDTYLKGENISVRVNAPEPGYIYAVGIHSNDSVKLLHPASGTAAGISGKGWITLPQADSRAWAADEPLGKNMIMVLYSKQPLDLAGFDNTAGLVSELERLSDTLGATEGLSSMPLFFTVCSDSANCG
jgi:serine/threonine protein kinase